MIVMKLNGIETHFPFLHKESPEQDGVIMDVIHDPDTLAIMCWLKDVSKEELEDLVLADIEVRMVQDQDKILALYRVTQSNWIFDVAFDPTAIPREHHQHFVEDVLHNQVFPLLVLDRKDEEASIVKGIRIIHFPDALLAAYIQSWGKALRNPSYSQEYLAWLQQLPDMDRLWDQAIPVGLIRG